MPDPAAEQGLHSAEGTLLEAAESPRKWSARRIAMQVIGLLIGLGLLGWAVSLSMSPQNQKSFEAMRQAPLIEVAVLLGLSFASLVLNGLMFWITLRPVRKLRAVDVVLTNSMATFLSILPFKLSLVMRILIHHRRDGVRFKVLVAWVAAMGALGMAVLLPFVGATLWRGGLDLWWWIAALAGVVACNALGVLLGRAAERWTILKKLSFNSDMIVRNISAVAGHGVFRLIDTAVLAGRFLASAAIADQFMPIDQAILVSTAYFLLSVLAPAGTLGFREGGVAALVALPGISGGLGAEQIALVALVVTAAEMLASGVLAIIAFIIIRPDRLIGANRARS